MTDTIIAAPRLDWGTAPSARYESLARPLRPLLARIAAGAVERDRTHHLPREEIAALRAEGFARLRLPQEWGGQGATLPEYFALLIELSEADPNITNALRSHGGFVEELLDVEPGAWRDRWLARAGAGDLVGSGFSESGDAPVGTYATRLERQGGGRWLLNGGKYYTTGSLYADWIHLGAVDEAGQPVGALVPTSAPGVEITDDWDGFGQRLTASGTVRFTDVALDDGHIKPRATRFRYSGGFFQLVHLAELAGIGRAATQELASLVAARRRIYPGRGTAPRSSQDPQVLEVVGKVRSAAYAAGAITLRAAEALERAARAKADGLDEAARNQVYAQADLEVAQAVTVVTSLILDATTVLFDALGASAAKEGLGLDRHWRNARTISSHNPRIYHTRIAGDHAVNGTPPPVRVGTAGGAPAPEQLRAA
ncbi:acyl-CoA dehydrogenase family protein [Xylophilus sp.]|uniref:acyl-CoA dehydrogenase family protein n=1 Tax=Xylophilus sp. TaxID=2653893 RepID=UPI0013BA3394|nr:acyl-CoA dehydrogenase family protein [Xylophilus sp.]KAF1047155.1 MAG: Dibenzothiophene desulfurization enzyme C [Xylophilus sp.]